MIGIARREGGRNGTLRIQVPVIFFDGETLSRDFATGSKRLVALLVGFGALFWSYDWLARGGAEACLPRANAQMKGLSIRFSEQGLRPVAELLR